MLRAIIGTVVGGLAALAVILVLERVGGLIFPLPPGADPYDPEVMKTLVAGMPLGGLLLVVAAWWLGAGLGGLVARRIGGRWPALTVGGLVSAMVVVNLIMLPHPLWMQIAGVLGPLAIGGTLWRARRVVAAAA